MKCLFFLLQELKRTRIQTFVALGIDGSSPTITTVSAGFKTNLTLIVRLMLVFSFSENTRSHNSDNNNNHNNNKKK